MMYAGCWLLVGVLCSLVSSLKFRWHFYPRAGQNFLAGFEFSPPYF